MTERRPFAGELLEIHQRLALISVNVEVILAQRIGDQKNYATRFAMVLRAALRTCQKHGVGVASDHRRAPISPQALLLTGQCELHNHALASVSAKFDTRRLPAIRDGHCALKYTCGSRFL